MRHHHLLFMSSVCLGALIASPVYAQDATGAPADTTAQKEARAKESRAPAATTNAKGEPSSGDIVITGSRVRHKNFTTAAPVNVITRDDTILAGTRTTAETLQSSTVTSEARFSRPGALERRTVSHNRFGIAHKVLCVPLDGTENAMLDNPVNYPGMQ